MSSCPPRVPCPPRTPPPCPAICPPPPPQPPCRVKPIMRGLHWSQTTSVLTQAIVLACLGGAAYYFLVALPRRRAYADFYAKAELNDWAEEMARKGLFQAVPKASLKDAQHMS